MVYLTLNNDDNPAINDCWIVDRLHLIMCDKLFVRTKMPDWASKARFICIHPTFNTPQHTFPNKTKRLASQMEFNYIITLFVVGNVVNKEFYHILTIVFFFNLFIDLFNWNLNTLATIPVFIYDTVYSKTDVIFLKTVNTL